MLSNKKSDTENVEKNCSVLGVLYSLTGFYYLFIRAAKNSDFTTAELRVRVVAT